ncbi:hypothetical protein [Streptomyces sp. SID13726]|uniref:hypothetical protein n=1 Tax=Streptomyces sp. SID13726 TaxID=2706058 RepID=UPI0013BC8AB9|nr:hypothetical protein [Streptomyces sp. SID13726]NEA98861.1 hypothetical protein [Streptomyces sp. SID13726]
MSTGSPGPATPVPTPAGLAHTSVLALPKPHQSALTAVIVAAVLLLLLVLLLRHTIRKRGGWRRFRRRLGQEATLTRRAFGEPLRSYGRHRRGVRALGRQLSDPRKGLLVRRLLDAAATALADAPGAFPYAVRTAPGHAAVQIAARRPPEPPAPWEPGADSTPQGWELTFTDEDTLPETGARPAHRLRPLPVAVGMADDACVHLDLAAGPRVITVEGDTAARTRLLHALAAQLDRPGSGATVTVTEGVHPHFRGRRLETLLGEVEERSTMPVEEAGEPGRTATTVVVCAAPNPEQARRLGALAASGTVVCLTDGRSAGHSWALHVDGRGRVTAPELELDADSAPLSRAVAASVRSDLRRRRREATPPKVTAVPVRPEPREEPRRPRTESLQETEPLQEAPTETVPRVTTGSELLAEPAAATRERTTAASSGTTAD